MKKGTGIVFVDLESTGGDDPLITVAKLDDGFVMVAVTEGGNQRRAILSKSMFREFALAVQRIANGDE